VAKVNRSYEHPLQISADTYQVIQDAVHFSELTSGAFDITVWPLIKLWKEAEEKNVLPDDQQLRTTLQAIGVRHIELLPDHTIRLLHPEAKIDLGGIAAGFAVDEAARILRTRGFKQFLIDAGGDLFAGGRNCKNRPWRIGIANPQTPSRLMNVMEVENKGIATSGDYEKFFEIQGERWSHIVNPKTGYPPKFMVSAALLAPSAEEADALSTAVTVLGIQHGLALVESFGEQWAAVMVVQEEGGSLKIYATKNFKNFKTP
jgi:thiamine biosynthesis lipoprotein